jgi:hypothetical protein
MEDVTKAPSITWNALSHTPENQNSAAAAHRSRHCNDEHEHVVSPFARAAITINELCPQIERTPAD